MSPAATMKPSAPITLTLLLALVLALVVTVGSPRTAHASSGCSYPPLITNLPTGQLNTYICGYAYEDTGGSTTFWVQASPLSARWRYTRCQVFVAAQVGGTIYRPPAKSCDDAIQSSIGGWAGYIFDGFPARPCNTYFKTWGHVELAYLHNDLPPTKTIAWTGRYTGVSCT